MILCVGDSNTTRNYVTEPGEHYADIIGAALGCQTIVAGVSGEYAVGALNRIPGLLSQHNPTHVTVMTGTNDMAGGISTPMATLLPAYLDTMGQIIDAIRVSAVPIIFSPPAIEQPQECLRYPMLIDALRALCLRKRCAFFDLYSLMADDAATMGPSAWLQWYLPAPADLYHLSATGHARLAAGFLALMAPLMVPEVPIGDMTPRAAAFDGVTATPASGCAKKGATTVTSYIGKAFTAPKTITGFRYWGSSDQGVSQGNTIELQCWVRTGAPASDIDGTYIGGTGTVADGGYFERLDLTPTAGDHVWVRVISTGELREKYCAEVEFIEA